MWSLENIEQLNDNQLFNESMAIIKARLYEVINSLQTARSSNIHINNELQKQIIGIYELLKISKNKSH